MLESRRGGGTRETRRHLAWITLVAGVAVSGGVAQEQRPDSPKGLVVGRSIVATTFGIVASSQPADDGARH
jgi:hypothetical protein